MHALHPCLWWCSLRALRWLLMDQLCLSSSNRHFWCSNKWWDKHLHRCRSHLNSKGRPPQSDSNSSSQAKWHKFQLETVDSKLHSIRTNQFLPWLIISRAWWWEEWTHLPRHLNTAQCKTLLPIKVSISRCHPCMELKVWWQSLFLTKKESRWLMKMVNHNTLP